MFPRIQFIDKTPFDFAIQLPRDLSPRFSAGDVILFQTAKQPGPGSLCLCERGEETLATFADNVVITSTGEVLPRESIKAVAVRIVRNV